MPDVILRGGRKQRIDVRLVRTRYTPSDKTVTSSGTDPATLSMQGYWRASYTGVPWVGVSSLGGSGASPDRDLEAGNVAGGGTPVNGYTPFFCDGATVFLVGDALMTWGDLIGATNGDFYIHVLARWNSATATAGVLDDPALLTDNGGSYALSYSTDGVRFACYDNSGTPQLRTVGPATAAAGSYHMIQVWHDTGANLMWIQVDGGTPVSATLNSSDFGAGNAIKVAVNWADAAFVDGDILEIAVTNDKLDASIRSDIRGYVQNKYAIAQGYTGTYTVPSTEVHPTLEPMLAAQWGVGNEDIILYSDASYVVPVNQFSVGVSAASSVADALVVARALATGIAAPGAVSPALRVARPLADVIAGPSTVVDALRVSRNVVDTIQGAGAVTDSLRVARGLVDAIAGAAAVVDAVRVSRPLQDTIVAPATVVDALRVSRPLADSISGAAVVVVALRPTRAFQDTITGAGTVTDSFRVARALVDSVSGFGAVVDALRVSRPFTDTIQGLAVVTDTARVARTLTDTISSAATVADALRLTKAFADAIAATSSMTDALRVSRGMVDTIAAATSVSDSVRVARATGASVSGIGTVNPALRATRPVAAVVAGQTSMVDALRLTRAFADAVSGSSALTLELRVLRQVILNITGTVGTFTVNLTVSSGGAASFNVSISGQVSVVDAVRITRAYASALSSSAAVSELLRASRSFVVTVSAPSTTVESASVARPYSGPWAGHTSVADALVVARRLADSMAGQGVVVESLARLRPMAGSWTANGSVVEALRVARLLTGSWTPSSSVVEAIRATRLLVGPWSASGALAADTQVVRRVALNVTALAQVILYFGGGQLVSFSTSVNARASLREKLFSRGGGLSEGTGNTASQPRSSGLGDVAGSQASTGADGKTDVRDLATGITRIGKKGSIE